MCVEGTSVLYVLLGRDCVLAARGAVGDVLQYGGAAPWWAVFWVTRSAVAPAFSPRCWTGSPERTGAEPGAEPGVGVADLLPPPLGVAARCFARHCAADRLTIWLIVRSATTPPLGLVTTPCLLRATGTKR